MTILDFARPAAGTAVVPVGESLWRVTRPTGEVLGYIERVAEAAGDRFRAKRMIVSQQRVDSIGEFWSADDAIQCFRVG